MRRIIARRTKAIAIRARLSKSLASLRQRPSQAKCPLDDPAFGQDPERRVVLAADDLQAPRPKPRHGFGGGCAGIGAIGDDAGQPLAPADERCQHAESAMAILDAGGMNGLGEDQTLRIDDDVALLALDLTSPRHSPTDRSAPPFSAPRTLCESIIPRLG
jgi:hypothetical protein